MLSRQETARAPSHLRADVSQRIKEFRRVKVKDGRTVWELTAREAEYFEDQGQVVVTRPEVSFFGEDGQNVAVKGREGRVFLSGATNLEKIELGGGIEVHVGEYVLRTDKAIWVQQEDVIVSPGHVAVQGAQISLDGEGMLVDLGRQRVQLLKGVRTTLRNDDSATPGAAPAGIPGLTAPGSAKTNAAAAQPPDAVAAVEGARGQAH
jgi:LPS export ABC transporter protein LptC